MGIAEANKVTAVNDVQALEVQGKRGRPRNRFHECQHDTPLTAIFGKLPSSAECAEAHCYWQRNCADASPESLKDLRALAIHHAKALRHEVIVHLRQDLLLIPEGEPLATGGESVPRTQDGSGSQRRSGTGDDDTENRVVRPVLQGCDEAVAGTQA
jgi:hypothetical protein